MKKKFRLNLSTEKQNKNTVDSLNELESSQLKERMANVLKGTTGGAWRQAFTQFSNKKGIPV